MERDVVDSDVQNSSACMRRGVIYCRGRIEISELIKNTSDSTTIYNESQKSLVKVERRIIFMTEQSAECPAYNQISR